MPIPHTMAVPSLRVDALLLPLLLLLPPPPPLLLHAHPNSRSHPPNCTC